VQTAGLLITFIMPMADIGLRETLFKINVTKGGWRHVTFHIVSRNMHIKVIHTKLYVP